MPPRLTRLVLVLVTTAGTAATAGPIPPSRYTFTNLFDRKAHGLNDAGQVVGEFTPIEDNGRAQAARGFLFESYGPQAGTIRIFEPFPSEYSPSYTNPYYPQTTASAINASGQVVGMAGRYVSDHDYHGFLASGQTVTDLGSLAGPDRWSTATAINRQGDVVGGSRADPPKLVNGYPEYDSHAFLYRDGQLHDLGTLGGKWSEATGINDAGQIVGNSSTTDRDRYGNPATRAFLSDGVPGHPLTDLGTLGGLSSSAHAINGAGQIVGAAQTASGEFRAFLHDQGQLHDLGVLGGAYPSSAATDINDAGQVVGRSTYDGPPTLDPALKVASAQVAGYASWGRANDPYDIASYFGTHAILASQGTLHDLNDLVDLPTGWVLTEALAINNLGQILATAAHEPPGSSGYLHYGFVERFSLLLTPEGLPTPAMAPRVPEPTTLAVFLLAGAGWGARRLVRMSTLRRPGRTPPP